ncbi:Imm26 family immunity protein [Leptospira levettii]|uniref:Imm26 family immunity protein n=1 Tax=Leptospira levettii TaxID=2023178 RepID=UPI001082DABB|nr:Imm26 family immunity protein [Leptospira levettii]TGM26163.1 hypothetical protein EHQ74_11245 [Leptospira levettii]
MNKKQRRTVGSIIKVPIDNYYIYGLILHETDIVFFDSKNFENLSVNEIVELPILFRVAANSDAVLDGRWTKIGKIDLPEKFSVPVPRFIQNEINPDKFEIYLGGQIRPAKKEECKDLERCAVWSVRHIEDRIRDHYNNMPNVWVEQMRLK